MLSLNRTLKNNTFLRTLANPAIQGNTLVGINPTTAP